LVINEENHIPEHIQLCIALPAKLCPQNKRYTFRHGISCCNAHIQAITHKILASKLR
jgi:hypothetical protein